MRKLFVLLLLAAANTAFAATTNTWLGTISQDWGVGGNWSSGKEPNSTDGAVISTSPGPLINSGTTAVANSVKVNGPLGVSGGTLTTSGSWIIVAYEPGTNGTLTIDSGTVTSGTTMYIGFDGTGTLYMNGGTINVVTGTGRFGIARDNIAAVGHVYLYGGTINCNDFTMATVAGSTATMEITGGKLVITGDKTATVATDVNNGWITGYGDKANVRYDYNITTLGKTTVWAYNGSTLPTKATSPTPASGAINVATNSTLSWSAGTNTTSHDVYFGTTSPGTSRGNQTSVTYNPGILDSNTTYYWRIDEVNESNSVTGDVWSFTTAPPAGPIPVNIHLSWNENAVGTTMTVIWATLTDVNSVVQYGLTNAYGSQQAGTSVWSAACNQFIHTVKLTGLSPNSTYHYSCGSAAAWSTDAAFITGLPVGDANEFTFAVGGDTRNPDDIVPNPTYAGYRIAVMNEILLQQPRFFMFLGDYTDRGQYQNQWDEIFDNLKPQVTTMPYMMVWGSHEDPDIAPNAYAQFDFPQNGISGDKDKYYSFDYGNVHFTVLFATAAAASNPLTNSLIPVGSAQYNWFESDLQRASSDPNINWKFVLVHAPPYSTATRSGGGSCVGLRTDIGPLLATYGVDVVFTAHEHNFERTHLIKNDSKVMDVPGGSVLVNPPGTIYYVSGGAGAGLNDCDGGQWFSATHQNLRHFLLVRPSGNTLNIKAIQVTGALLDEITIQHAPKLIGDFDLDGKVDVRDFSVFTGSWLDTGLWP